jgi:hypothetical protein
VKWQQITSDEAASTPEARLGGALLWMVGIAAVLFVLALAGALFALRPLRQIGGWYIIAVAYVAVWSALFIAMTLLRLSATPVVASAGIVAWIAYRLGVAILSDAGWPLTIDLLGEMLLAAGFCGYMAEGMRPNAYYRNRLPVL